MAGGGQEAELTSSEGKGSSRHLECNLEKPIIWSVTY